MKKILFALLLAGTVLVPALHADEKSAVWERIYRLAANDELRYAVLLNIRELHDRQLGPMLTEALSDVLARHIEEGNSNEVELKVRLATGLVQELGQLRELGAADQIFKVYEEVESYPLLKAEAALALGQMRATDYVPNLARDLADLNLAPNRDNAAAQEIVAFALVQSLASLKDARGYEPVFFASLGWYGPQRKVKETAKSMLKLLSPDPTEPLLKILQTPQSPVAELRVLEAEDDSQASDASKAKVALAALENGVRVVPADIVETTQWGDLRKKAMTMLVKSKDKTATAVALYRQQYKTAGLARDTSEILSILQLVGVNGTADALAYLIELMQGFNVRAGTPGLLTDFDVQQVRTILQAFRTAGDPAARPVLLEAQFLYTPALQRDVKAVLSSLPQ